MRYDFWNNPIIVSSFRVKFRRSGLWNITSLYLMLIVAAGMVLYYYQDKIPGGFFRNYLIGILGLQFFVSTVIAVSATAMSLRNEVVNRTLDFQRIASLPPTEFLFGKLLGEPALAYLLAIATIPFTFFCYLMGVEGLSFPVYLVIYLVLFSNTMMFGSLGLLQRLEVLPGRNNATGGQAGAGWAMAVAFAIVPQLIINAGRLLGNSASKAFVGLLTPAPIFLGLVNGNPFEHYLDFFGLKIPFIFLTAPSQLLIAFSWFHVMVRKLINPLQPSTSKMLTVLLILIFDIILAGAIYQPTAMVVTRVALPFSGQAALFLLLHLAFGMFCIGGATPWRESLESWVWRYRGRVSWLRDALVGERTENTVLTIIVTLLGLLAFGLLVALPEWLAHGMVEIEKTGELVPGILIVITVLSLSVNSMSQAYVAISGRSGAGLFWTTLLTLVVPVYLAGMYYRIESIKSLSPIDLFVCWFNGVAPTTILPVLLIYGAVGVVFSVLLRRKLRQMVRTVDGKLRGMGVPPDARLASVQA